jgi:hypothetical protein
MLLVLFVWCQIPGTESTRRGDIMFVDWPDLILTLQRLSVSFLETDELRRAGEAWDKITGYREGQDMLPG